MSSRTFGIVGLGNFGSTVAVELTRFGNSVLAIDSSQAAVSAHVEVLDQAIIADGRDEDALREAGIADCDTVLVAMGEDLESSVLTAMNLKLIGIEQVWAKAMSRTHHRILSKLGVDRVLHPEDEMGRHIAQVMHNPMVRDYVSMGNGYNVANVSATAGMAGRKLSMLDHAKDHDLRCLGVMRGTKFIGSDEVDCAIEEGDLVLLLGKRGNLRDFYDDL